MEQNNVEVESGLAASTTSPVEDKGVMGTLFGVLVAPVEAFKSYNQNFTFSKIIVPLVIIMIISAAFAGISGMYRSQDQLEILRNYDLPANVMQAMEAQANNPGAQKINAVVGVIFGLIITALATVISGLVAWLTGNFILGGEARFPRIWGISILAALPVALGNLVKIALMLMKGSSIVTLGFAILYPTFKLTSVFYQFLFYFDFIMIWGLIVWGVGFAVVYKFSYVKAMLTSVILSFLGFIVYFSMTTLPMTFLGVEITLF